MKFYSFEEIRAVGDCVEFAKSVFNATVHGGRCAAVWRGGDNPEAVSIKKDEWFDHVEKVGGGIIELAAYLYGGDKQQAQQFLGEHYGLAPKCQTGAAPAKSNRYDALIREGYTEVARYEYRDMEGNAVHFVARLEHPEKPKEFCQGSPKGWTLEGVETILYNLKAVAESTWAVIVEGEKKCDRLIALGVPATTCCGGAKKWHAGYAAVFAGKSVAILPDNDEPGREHARIIAATLQGIAEDIRIVTTSTEPKGDVADWLDEGHTVGDLMSMIADAPQVRPEALVSVVIPTPDTPEIKAAKAANQIPFRNFLPIKQQPKEPGEGERRRRRDAGPEIDKKPRLITEMIDDCHRRFLGFPRKVGEEMFDHDRETGRICYFWKSSELFAWIGRKSKQRTDWARGDNFVTKDEFFAGLQAAAIRYEAISHVPDWPRRQDVYYAHKPLPPPCPRQSRFHALVEMFLPASDADKTMLRAFLVAPLWYRYGIPKPSWIIDSEDGAGTGKSTIVEACAYLYRGEPIRTNRQELRMGIQDLIKRLVSSSGRQQRILLVDNITGQFSCPELADLITAQSVSGRAPYGHGEETRPNNLVYVLTANTATIDNDLADRSYYINVKRPNRDPRWRETVMRYIDSCRSEILADIVALLESPERVHASPQTRFPEFESTILQPLCGDAAEYQRAIAHLATCRADTNVEEEQARAIEDAIREGLVKAGVHPEKDSAFLTTQVVEFWLRDTLEKASYAGSVSQHVRNLAKMRLIPMIDARTKRWPHHGPERRSGFLWNREAGGSVRTLFLRGKEVEVRA